MKKSLDENAAKRKEILAQIDGAMMEFSKEKATNVDSKKAEVNLVFLSVVLQEPRHHHQLPERFL